MSEGEGWVRVGVWVRVWVRVTVRVWVRVRVRVRVGVRVRVRGASTLRCGAEPSSLALAPVNRRAVNRRAVNRRAQQVGARTAGKAVELGRRGADVQALARERQLRRALRRTLAAVLERLSPQTSQTLRSPQISPDLPRSPFAAESQTRRKGPPGRARSGPLSLGGAILSSTEDGC